MDRAYQMPSLLEGYPVIGGLSFYGTRHIQAAPITGPIINLGDPTR